MEGVSDRKLRPRPRPRINDEQILLQGIVEHITIKEEEISSGDEEILLQGTIVEHITIKEEEISSGDEEDYFIRIKCKETYKSGRELGDSVTRWNCESCKYRTNCKLYFEKHLFGHSSAKAVTDLKDEHQSKCMLKCLQCPYITHDITECYAHYHIARKMGNHSVKKKDESSVSQAVEEDANPLFTERILKCTECSYQTSHLTLFSKHFNQCHSNKLTKTHKYEVEYQPKVNIQTSKVPEENAKFICPSCPYKCKKLNSFNCHLVKHMPEELIHKCSKCSYRTSSKVKFTNHINKIYSCAVCDFKSHRHAPLRTHIKNHDFEAKRFRCSHPQCSYITESRDKIVNHINKHSGQYKYHCNECHFKTNHKEHFSRHSQKHTELRFTCDLCQYKTSLKGLLTTHMMNHAGVKTFKCEICGYGTNWKPNLTTHMFIHKDSKRFKCSLCQHETNRKFNLEQHLKSVHKISDPKSVTEVNKEMISSSEVTQENNNSKTVTEEGIDDITKKYKNNSETVIAEERVDDVTQENKDNSKTVTTEERIDDISQENKDNSKTVTTEERIDDISQENKDNSETVTTEERIDDISQENKDNSKTVTTEERIDDISQENKDNSETVTTEERIDDISQENKDNSKTVTTEERIDDISQENKDNSETVTTEERIDDISQENKDNSETVPTEERNCNRKRIYDITQENKDILNTVTPEERIDDISQENKDNSETVTTEKETVTEKEYMI